MDPNPISHVKDGVTDFVIIEELKFKKMHRGGKIEELYLCHAALKSEGTSLCGKVRGLKANGKSYRHKAIWNKAHCMECLKLREKILTSLGIPFRRYRLTQTGKQKLLELKRVQREKEDKKFIVHASGNSVRTVSGGLPSLGKRG